MPAQYILYGINVDKGLSKTIILILVYKSKKFLLYYKYS